MKKFVIILISLILSVNTTLAANQDFFLGVKYNSAAGKNEIYKINQTTGESTLLKQFTFPSGYWQPGASFMDSYNGNLYLKDSNGQYLQYNYITDTLTTTPVMDSDYQTMFQTPWAGSTIVSEAADGSVHIGENSLVTIEQNGKQSLYATDASGQSIPLNINNGSRLQVNGVDVMDKIDGTMALSSAMSALPNSSEDATSTCGMGTGFHKGVSAISAGCAMDFATLTQSSNLSPLFKRASVNLGSSAIINGSGFSNFALRAGLTFKLGAKKSSGTDLGMDEDLQRYSTGTNTRIAELKKENEALRAEMDALNAKLDALIASLNNG